MNGSYWLRNESKNATACKKPLASPCWQAKGFSCLQPVWASRAPLLLEFLGEALDARFDFVAYAPEDR